MIALNMYLFIIPIEKYNYRLYMQLVFHHSNYSLTLSYKW